MKNIATELPIMIRHEEDIRETSQTFILRRFVFAPRGGYRRLRESGGTRSNR